MRHKRDAHPGRRLRVDATRADRAGFERHLARCQQCAREIARLREATARLATAAAASPPPGLNARAMAAAARTRQRPPGRSRRQPSDQARPQPVPDLAGPPRPR